MMDYKRAHARDEVVDEPSERDGHKADPVTLNNEPIRDSSVAHRILSVMRRIFHVQPPKEDGQCGNGSQPEGQAPNSAQVVIAKSGRIESS